MATVTTDHLAGLSIQEVARRTGFSESTLRHFALTAGLRTALAAAGGARIVSLSSSAHLHSPVVFGDLDFRFRPYDPRQAYAESKTAAVMLAVEATRRWSADGIYASAVNPGAIATGLQKYTGGLKTPVERRKSVEQGAATSVFLAASPLAEGIGGRDVSRVAPAAKAACRRRRASGSAGQEGASSARPGQPRRFEGDVALCQFAAGAFRTWSSSRGWLTFRGRAGRVAGSRGGRRVRRR
jgi:NAD(P)-dependent dehydrogenase (short-subunit alcohol dehydrogenase family)